MHESGLPLALTLLLVFGSAKLLGELFEALHQPAMVGEILAGILIGPSVLHWVQPNATLTVLAELGVMFLLFDVGLHVKASDLLRVGTRATLVATAGVVLPFLAGWGLMRWWAAPQAEAIFVGAAMVATSVGITASVLAGKGLLEQTSAQVILAAAVIDDVLGLIVLAVASSVARGSVNLWEIGLTALVAIGFTLILAIWGTSWAGHLMPRFQSKARAEEAQFHLALMLMFGLAALAAFTGVAAIIGAFLAGMALSETVEARVQDLTRGINEFLVPFFLAGIGLHLDLAPFGRPDTIVLAGLILLAACFSKFIGCGLAAAPLGWRTAAQVGVGMIPRGEVGMVVAQMGLSLAVIPSEVYGVVVFMAVMTTVITPPLLSVVFAKAK